MRLELQNVGRINQASVEVNGITVIAGENDTGKTTIGKVFYCLLMTFMNIDTMLDNQTNLSIYEALCGLVERVDLENITSDFFLGFFQQICDNKEEFIKNPDALKAFIEKASASLHDFENNASLENALRAILGEEIETDFLRTRRNDRIDTVFERILSILKTDVVASKRKALEETLAAEFKGQIGNVYSEETMSFMSLETDSGEAINVRIKDNEDITLKKSTNIGFGTAYIDGSAALDVLNADVVTSYDHKATHINWLVEMLTTKFIKEEAGESSASEKLTRILERLNRVCDGEIVRGEDCYVYISPQCEKPLPLSYISDGQKLFLILKTILMKGNLGEGAMLILDNPENHLHPEWQLSLAEIVVLLQKEFGVRILVNTHSPYLLRGIETYSARYDVSERCKYYLAEAKDEQAHITDVTKCVEAIYRLLYHPLESI